MSVVRTNAAAAMLGVSPNTLRSWERRFGYPTPRRSEGGHRQYELGELEALRRALLETHNISSAIQLAQERVTRAMRALDPRVLVLCGSGATLDAVGRLVYSVRQSGSQAPLHEYRGAMPVN